MTGVCNTFDEDEQHKILLFCQGRSMTLDERYDTIADGQKIYGWSIGVSGDGGVILRDNINNEMYERKTPNGNWVKCGSVGDGFTTNDPE
jgi:hypothetical protein